MKPSGIIRRIDDLGRIVIPKEIRKAIGAGEDAPMEIYYDRKGRILLQKYCPEKDLVQQVMDLDDAVTDVAAELGAETTDGMRRHIRGMLILLKEGEEE